MTLGQSQLSTLRKNLDQLHHSLLEQVRDAREKTEDQQYVEIIGRVPADGLSNICLPFLVSAIVRSTLLSYA